MKTQLKLSKYMRMFYLTVIKYHFSFDKTDNIVQSQCEC